MFADVFEITLGDTKVKGRRLSLAELRENWKYLLSGRLDVDRAEKVIREHVTLEDGTPVDPEEMTQGQIQTLVAEMTLPKEGRAVADFIGLLC